jgi:periplasmic protein TonB
MAADLFGDVTQTPTRLGGRQWYTLPLSIVTHAVTVVVIVVVPLATSDMPPPIRRALTHFADMDITPVVPPPPPMRREPTAGADTPVSRDAAPTVAPPEIGPETFPLDLPEVGGADGVPNGIPGGLSLDSVTSYTPPQPPPIEPPKTMRITRGVTPPRRITYVQPVYPSIALQNRITGRVVIEAIIGPTGDVQSTRVVQSVHLLDEAALEAVRQWKYTPTLLSGVPVSVILTVSVDFTLGR